MDLKSTSYINRFRISWKESSDIRYMNKHETDIRNHYVMRSAKFKRSHGNVHV